MTGDAPQPGETPRNDSNLWSYREPEAAWWRPENERQYAAEPAGARRPATVAAPAVEDEPAFAEEALDAHAAGVQDTGVALTEPVERDHDASTDERYLPGDDDNDDPADVMVLPEPGPNRPTVALPGQSRSHPDAALAAARERMENSPFWMTDEERAAASATGVRVAAPGEELRGKPPRTAPRTPQRPVAGLAGLVALALIAAFFAWVSAEPFWLTFGHSHTGQATVAECVRSGVAQRCTGSFTAASDGYTVKTVTLLGVGPEQRAAGTVVAGKMISSDSRQVYVGGSTLLLNLRWVLGFLLVLLCGYGVAGLTGARQLDTARARRGAVLTSLAGPVLLLIGFLVAAY